MTGWKISVPDAVPEDQSAHPAVARTYSCAEEHNLRYPEGYAWDLLSALWYAYQAADCDSPQETFYSETMDKIDPRWEDDWGPNEVTWEPVEKDGSTTDASIYPHTREMPTAFFERLDRMQG